MSLKKELLSRLNLEQLKEFAEKKGISFVLNDTQKQYYSEWTEKEKIIDMMNDNKEVSIQEIEEHIKSYYHK